MSNPMRSELKRDLADEAERARTPPTPFIAFAGVWLAVAVVVVAMLITVGLVLYFVAGVG